MRDDCSLVINTSCKSFSSNLALVLLIEVQEHLYLYEIRLEVKIWSILPIGWFYIIRNWLHKTRLIFTLVFWWLSLPLTCHFLPFFETPRYFEPLSVRIMCFLGRDLIIVTVSEVVLAITSYSSKNLTVWVTILDPPPSLPSVNFFYLIGDKFSFCGRSVFCDNLQLFG